MTKSQRLKGILKTALHQICKEKYLLLIISFTNIESCLGWNEAIIYLSINVSNMRLLLLQDEATKKVRGMKAWGGTNLSAGLFQALDVLAK